MNPNSSIEEIGAWNKQLASDVKKLESFNLTPVEVTKDQLIQLYLLLYPFIASEYVHRSDLVKWEEKIRQEFLTELQKINSSIESLKTFDITHVHSGVTTGPGSSAVAAGAPPVTQSAEAWKAKPEDYKQGEGLITGGSNYTQSMNHRDPKKDATGYSPKIKISDEFKKAEKYKPFDAGDGELNTGDDNFVNAQ